MSCAEGTSIYRLTLLDTAGDGWQGAEYTVRSSSALEHTGEGAVVGSGTLPDGYSSIEWLCLANGCYELEVTAGSAPEDIGFEFHDEGSGHFSGEEAPFGDHFCVAEGSVFAHPTQSPSLSVLPSLAPTETPSSLPVPVPSAVPTPLPAPVPTALPTRPPSISPTAPLAPLPTLHSPSPGPTAMVCSARLHEHSWSNSLVPNIEFLHVDVVSSSAGMSVQDYSFTPGTFAHWRSAFGASHYTSASYVTSYFEGYVGMEDEPVGVSTTRSSVRLYRSNPVAKIDAVLKTVRVYPGEDIYVGFSALDVDANRFVDSASVNQLRLRVSVGDADVDSNACVDDTWTHTSLGYCTVSSSDLASLFTNASQPMSAYVYRSSSGVRSTVLSGVLAADPSLGFDETAEVAGLLGADPDEFQDGKVFFACSTAAVWVADSPDYSCSMYYYGGSNTYADGSASDGLMPYFFKIALDFSGAAGVLLNYDSGPVSYTHDSSVYDHKLDTWDDSTGILTITLQCNDCATDGSGDYNYARTVHHLGTLTASLQLSSDGYDQAVLDEFASLYASSVRPILVVHELEIEDYTLSHRFVIDESGLTDCQATEAFTLGTLKCFRLNQGTSGEPAPASQHTMFTYGDHDGVAPFAFADADVGPVVHVRWEVASGILASPKSNARALATDSDASVRAGVLCVCAFV